MVETKIQEVLVKERADQQKKAAYKEFLDSLNLRITGMCRRSRQLQNEMTELYVTFGEFDSLDEDIDLVNTINNQVNTADLVLCNTLLLLKRSKEGPKGTTRTGSFGDE